MYDSQNLACPFPQIKSSQGLYDVGIWTTELHCFPKLYLNQLKLPLTTWVCRRVQKGRLHSQPERATAGPMLHSLIAPGRDNWQRPGWVAGANNGVSLPCGGVEAVLPWWPAPSKPQAALRHVNALKCIQKWWLTARPAQKHPAGVVLCSLLALINTGCSPIAPQT